MVASSQHELRELGIDPFRGDRERGLCVFIDTNTGGVVLKVFAVFSVLHLIKVSISCASGNP